MKKLLLIIALLNVAVSQAAVIIRITNNQGFARKNEVVTINRQLLVHVPQGHAPVVKYRQQILITQLIDTNADRRWDALLVEVSLPAKQTADLEITWVPTAEALQFTASTNIRFSLKSKDGKPAPEISLEKRLRGFVQDIGNPYYQLEGPGIENDKVGFRIFFDARNGKDVYGKITQKPVLDQVGLAGSWHEMQDWGMDIFKTGKSLSAGCFAILQNKQFYPLADADSTVFTALYEGPLQASFRLDFFGWDAGESKCNGSETITITKGDFFYRNTLKLTMQPGQQLIMGVANYRGLKPVYQKNNNIISSLNLYGPQAEGTGTQLGTALLFNTAQYMSHHQATANPLIPNSDYVLLKPATIRTVYFLACWEKTDTRFATRIGFESYVAETAQRLAHPIQTTILY